MQKVNFIHTDVIIKVLRIFKLLISNNLLIIVKNYLLEKAKNSSQIEKTEKMESAEKLESCKSKATNAANNETPNLQV